MEWRRRLAAIEEAYDVQLSPFEKSPHLWRQAMRRPRQTTIAHL